MAKAWVGLGSNLGSRLGHMRKGLALICELPGTRLVAVSSVYDTTPVGMTDQPRFLNAACEIETDLEPEALLNELLTIEDLCGRVRRDAWGPRTLDLDLLVYEAETRATETLRLPHPRIGDRGFVLVPLAEIAPDLAVPGTDRTVRELLEDYGETVGEVRLAGGPPSPCAED